MRETLEATANYGLLEDSLHAASALDCPSQTQSDGTRASRSIHYTRSRT